MNGLKKKGGDASGQLLLILGIARLATAADEIILVGWVLKVALGRAPGSARESRIRPAPHPVAGEHLIFVGSFELVGRLVC